MATLRKRTSKKGYIWFVDFYINGHRHRKSTGTSDRRIAEKIRQKIEGDLVMKKFGVPIEKENVITLKEFIKKYLEYSKANKAPGTYEIDKYALNKALEVLRDKELKNINLLDCEKYKIERAKSVAKTTVNIEIRSLKSAFEVARRWSYVAQNPFKEIKQFKIQKSNIPQYLNKNQIKALLNIIEDPEFKNLILFYLYTGCRRNEALNLEWKDVDLKNRNISFLLTKSGSSRTVPINPKLLEILKIMKDKNTDKKVFNYLPNYVTKKFKKYLKSIGFRENKSIHILRHTFASHFMMSGLNIFTLKKILGHSSIKQTEIYSHLAPDYFQKEVEKFDFK